MGASEVRRATPLDMQAAMAAFYANGGTVTVCRPSQHGECLKRKGIQFKKVEPQAPREQGPRDLMADPTIGVSEVSRDGVKFSSGVHSYTDSRRIEAGMDPMHDPEDDQGDPF